MSVKRGKPVTREPVVLLPCRGCGAEPSLETIGFSDTGVVCLSCGISDPCGLFGPMRPAPAERGGGGAVMHRRRKQAEDVICHVAGHRWCHCGYCKRCGACVDPGASVQDAIKRASVAMTRDRDRAGRDGAAEGGG